jgi:hypothetical protein
MITMSQAPQAGDPTMDAPAAAPVAGGALGAGQAFLGALTRRDFAGLEACFAPDVAFRALVPSGVREGADRHAAVAWLRRWFGDADLFEMQHVELGLVADRLRISYRIRLRKEGVWYLIEQQAYCVVGTGQVSAMNLVCSGFRPV